MSLGKVELLCWNTPLLLRKCKGSRDEYSRAPFVSQQYFITTMFV